MCDVAGGKWYSFGGLTGLVCADFWQLPSPDGGNAGDNPTEFLVDAREFKESQSEDELVE